MSDLASSLPEGYKDFLDDLKERIRRSQLRAALNVNHELVRLYWQIGRAILEQQRERGWGARVIERLSADLSHDFPGVQGFSTRNPKYMRAFAEAYPDEQIVQQVVAQIPWGHNVRLLDKVKDGEERLWYARAAFEYSWSRNVLIHQIDTKLYQRQGKAQTNFSRTLPDLQSDLAQQVLKDPYTFDFLTLGDEAKERDLERGLLEHLRRFLLELGVGFAFVGSQYHLEVGGEDFYLDLLFYHLRLRCFVVIDLKVGAFRPEDAGKLNFYLSAVDDLLRHPQDEPTIGILLCRGKNRMVAEYALRGMTQPMGVSEYQLSEVLSAPLLENLPSIEALEAELDEPSSDPPE